MWQAGILLGNPQKVLGINFSGNNQIMYGNKYNNDYWHGDIEYYQWDGNQWIWGGWLLGDVNSTSNEEEPFITYDGQHIYFMRWYGSSEIQIYIADWNGSGFYNSRPLGPQINNPNARYPSLTQDGQKLYFTRTIIYESTWNGNDWGNPIALPSEVNSGGSDRFYVTISPDGNEIYFCGAGSYIYKLAYSKKIGGIWQQWQYCDYNINPPGMTCVSPGLTYGSYETQELYYNRPYGVNALTYHFHRSPVSVEPASLGQIKANYAR